MAKKQKLSGRKKPEPKKPDFEKFFRSVRSELDSVKDRIRDLVSHWPSDGSHKEAVLRNVLRRHLPSSLQIAKGFIVTSEASSGEIDILIIDRNSPTLFRDDDFVIVMPSAVRAMVSVKTTLEGPSKITKALREIAFAKQLCFNSPNGRKATGSLFVYDSKSESAESLLRCLGKTFAESQMPIDVINYGKSCLVKFFRDGRSVRSPVDGCVWHAYSTDSAASLFISCLLDGINAIEFGESGNWFAGQRESLASYYLPLGGRTPLSFDGRIPRRKK